MRDICNYFAIFVITFISVLGGFGSIEFIIIMAN